MQNNYSSLRDSAKPADHARRSDAVTSLWLLAALLVSAFETNSVRAAQQVEIYSTSLRFHNSVSVSPIGGWHLDLSSGLSDAPANGELALADGTDPFTHTGFISLTDEASSRAYYYPVDLNIPTDDVDGNGIFDVLEQQAVTAIQTSGSYMDADQNAHPILATWTKLAGAYTGTCAIELPDLGLTFLSIFENIHYSGTYVYTKNGSSVAGQVAVQRNGVETSTLAGSLNLQILDPSTLAWGVGQWITETGAVIDYEGSDLDRSGALEYSAFYVAADGYLMTATPDYQTWLLVLPNIPDADGNGIPDLVEGGVPLIGPTLALSISGTAVTLTITGGRGRTLGLETTSSLSVPQVWNRLGTYTFPTDSESFSLDFSSDANAFYRLKQ